MTAPNVRSATVRFRADVAKYMADVKAAGKVTDEAFSNSRVQVASFDRDVQRATGSLSGLSAQTRVAQRDTVYLGTSMDRTGNAIDRTSGRLALLAKSIAVLGPGLIPIGAAGTVGLAGMVGLFSTATLGAVGLAVATQGVGTALKAVEKARLEPTVENLQAAREAMQGISPEAREWVRQAQDLIPVLRNIRDAGAAGLFPGLTESIDDFERLEPILTRFMAGVGEAGGDAIADATDSLASRRWKPFLNFLADEAPDAIRDVTTLVGDLAHGAAQLWMAFDPGNDRFTDWALDLADAFDRYASSAQGRRDIQAFLSYAAENGPVVADATVALANAIVQVVQAAAPLGGPVLQAITAIADGISAIADSPFGTPIMAGVAALSALSLASKAATGSLAALSGGLAAAGLTGTSASLTAATKGGPLGLMLAGVLLNVENLQAAMGEFQKGTSDGDYMGLLRMAVPGLTAVDKLLSGIDKAADARQRLASDTAFMEDALSGKGWETDGLELFAAALGRAGDEARGAAADIDAFSTSVAAAMGILDRRAALDAFEASVDAARKGFREFGDTLDRDTEAGRTNRANLDAIARSALTAAEHLKPLQRADFLRGASEQFVHMARDMGMSREAAEDLADRLFHLDKVEAHPRVQVDDKEGRARVRDLMRELDLLDGKVASPKVALLYQQFLRGKITVEEMMRFLNGLKAEPKVFVNAGSAIQAANSVAAAINRIPKSRTSIITTVHRTFHERSQGSSHLPSPVPGSDGMTVPGPREPYADKVLAYLAPGEEVISNRYGQADRFRADRAAGRIPGYAEGGTIPAVATRSGDSPADREVRRETENRKRLNAQLKESERAVERERRQRDEIADRMKQISSDIRSSLTTDLGGDSDVWSSGYGFAGDLATLRGDTSRGRRFNRLRRILEEKGFNGPALADLLSRGDITEIADYAGQSRGELRQFERAFRERSRVLAVASREGADAALGHRLDDANRELREANRELNRIKDRLDRGNRDRREEHQQDRNQQRRGASNARRNRRRDT